MTKNGILFMFHTIGASVCAGIGASSLDTSSSAVMWGTGTAVFNALCAIRAAGLERHEATLTNVTSDFLDNNLKPKQLMKRFWTALQDLPTTLWRFLFPK